MERLEWSERYLVGVERIDRQHRRLFEVANRLIDASCEQQPQRETLSDAFAALTDYARKHFSTEEMIMEEAEFPDRHHHAGLHLEFIEQVGEMAMATIDRDPDVLDKLARYLRSWLHGHILGNDLLLKRYLEKNRGS